MKRVRAACILQTLVFQQKNDGTLPKEAVLAMNRREYERYRNNLERTSTKYQILREEETEEGSVVIHIRKQYNFKVDTDEYFV